MPACACADVSAQALFGRGPESCVLDLECDSGGSVRVILGGTLILSRCGFHDNLVDGGVASAYHTDGGALLIDQGHANISDSVFANNSAAGNGAVGLYSSTFHVTRCRFVDNHARTFGGALLTAPTWASSTPCRGVIEHSDFVARARPELAHATLGALFGNR